MAKAPKWHHRVLGTVDDRRRWRDVVLRKFGLARTHAPMELVRRKELALPNVVRGMAADCYIRQQELTFVQVGAFDGSSDDDLTSLLDYANVRGVFVEPQPGPFAELQRRFARFDNVTLANAAIATSAGEQPFYSTGSGSRLASFDRENLLRHGVAAREITSQTVRCLPLDQLLEEVGFARLDVLQVDAEGYDLQVLSTLEFERWMPAVVRFEYLHLATREVDRYLGYLSSLGYKFLIQDRDIVACRTQHLVAQAA